MRCLTLFRLALATLGATLVFACTPSQRVAVEGGVERAQQIKDAEARVLKASICAMSIGAYHRVNGDLERRAIDVLCGGIDGALAGAEELKEVR